MKKTVVGVKLYDTLRREYSQKEYHFFALDDVVSGDLVVVETVNGFTIGKISKHIGLHEKNFASKYIVQIIDKDSYLEKVKEAEKTESMKAKLNSILEQESEKQHYLNVAKDLSNSEEVRGLALQLIEKMTK